MAQLIPGRCQQKVMRTTHKLGYIPGTIHISSSALQWLTAMVKASALQWLMPQLQWLRSDLQRLRPEPQWLIP